jgi:hypothetical protein
MIFCHLSELVIVIAFRWMLSNENKKRDKIMLAKRQTETVDMDQTAFGDLTDWENENFRYVY